MLSSRPRRRTGRSCPGYLEPAALPCVLPPMRRHAVFLYHPAAKKLGTA
ncbi:hypothetical protein ACIRU8_45875 [Streptomyces sp. NPDC101175]